MPPGSAPPWTNVLFADTPGPVCPQKLPDMKNMSAERKEMFKRLAQHLSNESEDCLFLNIYTPLQGKFLQFYNFSECKIKDTVYQIKITN